MKDVIAIEIYRKEIKSLKLLSYVLSSLVLVLTAKTFIFDAYLKPEIIRVKGIIVEDVNGNERILIGAPVPFASNRVRTDLKRVKELWGKSFPAKYIDWYKNYKHENNGMVILDSAGFDRITIGSPVPDPNIGKRIGQSTGVIINDEKGFERTGYGVLDIDGKNRVVLGLDNENGTEGLSLVILEDGTSGFVMNNADRSLFLGKADSINWHTKNLFPFHGLLIKNKNGKNVKLNSYEKEQ